MAAGRPPREGPPGKAAGSPPLGLVVHNLTATPGFALSSGTLYPWTTSSRALAREPQAVASHTTAARVWNLPLLPAGPLDIEVTVPPRCHLRARAGLRRYRLQLPSEQIEVVCGVPVTSVARTLLDLACRGPRLSAVAAADSARNREMLTADELSAALWHLTGRHGGRRGAAWLRQVDGGAQSALETAVRLLLLDAQLPRPALQHALTESGETVARADLAYPESGVWIECDGWSAHGSRGAFQQDRWRQNVLTSRGWIVLRFTADDVLQRPAYVISAVRRALNGATAPRIAI